MTATFPSGVKQFPVINPGDPILSATENAQQDEIKAIETELLKSSGSVIDHGALAGLGDNDHPQYRTANSIRLVSISGGMADNTATSITPTNSQGVLFLRTLGGYVMACVFYDAVSGTAYCSLLVGTSNVEVQTGVLSGSTGTDGKFTISAHTDGKVYFENRCGSTLYPAYLAL